MTFDPKIIEKEKEIMLNAFLVALAVFICVGGAELIGFTMLNRPIVIGPLVGLFLGDVKTGFSGRTWNCNSSRYGICNHAG